VPAAKTAAQKMVEQRSHPAATVVICTNGLHRIGTIAAARPNRKITLQLRYKTHHAGNNKFHLQKSCRFWVLFLHDFFVCPPTNCCLGKAC
jgi:hypothetical protein